MELKRQKVRNQVLGPRALAVISCALALLAAQPMTGMGRRGGETAAASVKVAGGTQCGMVNGEFSMGEKNEGQNKRAPTTREVAGFASSPRLHVLATVEMLGRMLAFELRPPTVDRQLMPALVFEASPIMGDLVLAPPYRDRVIDGPTPILSYERQFAIEQCLLAPPIA